MSNSTSYSVDDGDGTNLCGGLTREAAHIQAQRHANKTGLACLVYGQDYEKCVEPDADADDADADAADADLSVILTAEQRERHAIGALPAREMRWALGAALIASVAARLGEDFVVDVLDQVDVTHPGVPPLSGGCLDGVTVAWGELPRGGFDVVRRLGLIAGAPPDEWRAVGGRLGGWGNASELATGPVVALSVTADDGTAYVLGISRA